MEVKKVVVVEERREGEISDSGFGPEEYAFVLELVPLNRAKIGQYRARSALEIALTSDEETPSSSSSSSSSSLGSLISSIGLLVDFLRRRFFFARVIIGELGLGSSGPTI